jgi:hypothetical protein
MLTSQTLHLYRSEISTLVEKSQPPATQIAPYFPGIAPERGATIAPTALTMAPAGVYNCGFKGGAP